jgi:mannose-6-phosphate isomerase-like protein (cupin superfamily)
MREAAMAGYTVVNLKDVEDMGPKFGFAPDMEARFARVPLDLRNSGLSYFRLAPGYRIPFGHRHGEQEEVYLVVGGWARVKIDDDVVEMRAWDAVRIPVGAARGLEAGSDGAEVVAFGAPNTDNKDVEMLQNWWAD